MQPDRTPSAAIRCPSCGPKPKGGVYCPDCGEVLLHGTSSERYESDRVIWEFGPEESEAVRPGAPDERPVPLGQSKSAAQRCRARVQTEWGLRCARKATKVWKGIKLCSQHERVARRGNLNIDQDVVRDGE